MTKTTTFSLDQETVTVIQRMSEYTGMSKSKLIREAVRFYRESKLREHFSSENWPEDVSDMLADFISMKTKKKGRVLDDTAVNYYKDEVEKMGWDKARKVLSRALRNEWMDFYEKDGDDVQPIPTNSKF